MMTIQIIYIMYDHVDAALEKILQNIKPVFSVMASRGRDSGNKKKSRRTEVEEIRALLLPALITHHLLARIRFVLPLTKV